MRIAISALALATALFAQTAFAGSPCGSTKVAPPTTPTPPAPAAQAQRPQSTRSYSYQAPATTSMGTGRYYRSQPRAIHETFGWRRASAKINGHY